MRRYSLVCDDRVADRIERLANQYGMTQQEVIEQLLEVGIDELDRRLDV